MTYVLETAMIFLQSVSVGGAADSTAAAASPAAKQVTISLLDLTLMGGWFMIPIVALLVWCIYLFFERYQTIRKSNSNPEAFLRQVRELVRAGDLDRAMMLCTSTNTPFARMVAKGISRLGSPLADIAASIENEGKIEIQRLEKRLAYLATIAGAAPMLGFLGTVTGMISAFMKIAQLQGNVNPAALAGGIYEAMITTAAGLIVGIPAYIGYNVLTNMLNSVISKMEITTTEFIDVLQEPAR